MDEKQMNIISGACPTPCQGWKDGAPQLQDILKREWFRLLGYTGPPISHCPFCGLQLTTQGETYETH